MEKIIAKNETHKAEFNFSHDTAVAIILSGLGYMTKINPQLASTLFVELHEENEEYFVTATFNDLPLTYGLCTEIKCKFETFKENVRQRTFPGTIEEVCFGKTTSFLEALLQKY